MIKVLNELIEAVQKAIQIGTQRNIHHIHTIEQKQQRPFSHVLERKQSLRRVDKAVRSFEKEFHRVQKIHDDVARGQYIIMRDDEKEESSHHHHHHQDESLTLDDDSLSSFVDILTKLPLLYGTEQNVYEESNRRMESDHGIDDMLEYLVQSASRMVLDYAPMPLPISLADRLLDRVAVLTVRGIIAHDLISILNKSIVAPWADESMELGRPNKEKTRQTQDSSLPQDGSSDIMTKPPLFLLGVGETLSLTLLLTPITLEHLSNHFTFPTAEASSEKEGFRLRQQSGEIGMRLLLLHIFRHLVDLLSENGQDEAVRGHEVCVGALKDAYEGWYRGQLDNTHHGDDMQYEVERGFEDYMDMLTSFLVENIEYASDALSLSNDFITHGSADLSDHYGTYIAVQIKEVTKLCSFAIGVVDLFHSGLGLYTSVSLAQLESSLIQYANYIATFCYSHFLPNSNATIVPADEALLRLYLLVSETYEEPLSKRARIDSTTRTLQKTQARMISFLRATHLFTTQCHEHERAVVSMELDRLQATIKHTNPHPKHMMDSHAAASILQARALASVVMGEHDDPQSRMRNSELLASLIAPITFENQKEEDTQELDANIMANLDPWSFLLARKINESHLNFNHDGLESRCHNLTPPFTILTNSASISETRSQTTSFVRGDKCESQRPSRIASFLESVPTHIHTLHQY